MNPQQDIYNMCYEVCNSLGKVYESVPGDGVGYPFMWMSETQLIPERNKTAIFANVEQVIRFYSTDKQRGTLSQLMHEVEMKLRSLKQTDSFFIDVINVNNRVLSEVDGNDNLYHGILEIEFKVF